jgi:hypothetical protein
VRGLIDSLNSGRLIDILNSCAELTVAGVLDSINSRGLIQFSNIVALSTRQLEIAVV